MACQMRVLVTLVLSLFFLVVKGEQVHLFKVQHIGFCDHIVVNKIRQEQIHAHKTMHLSKGLTPMSRESDSLTELTEDLQDLQNMSLRGKDLLLFSYVFLLSWFPLSFKNKFPFTWQWPIVASYKYILQRVLRI